MKFQKLNTPSLKELFVTELETMILSGKLEIGAKLPPERELAESMQVSRAVINSGIAELEKKGFLVVKPRIGTFVADYRRYGTTDTLVSIMRYNGGNLRHREVSSILEVRTIFMTLASKLAIRHASDADIRSLETYVFSLKECTDAEKAASISFDFCHQLAYISGNVLLPAFFISFRDLVCGLWIRYVVKYGIMALSDSTAILYQYLLARDEAGAAAYIEKTSNDSIDGLHTIYSD